jgi:NADH-quinone oxidoreductase subunit A
MTPLVAYVLLFIAVGVGFILVHLLAGKLIRPSKPDAEKGTIYECGEPTIGSAWVQFDLRFYVVALLFVIFDVEVAFFFPWAEVFGKANNLAARSEPHGQQEVKEYGEQVAQLHPDPKAAEQIRRHYQDKEQLPAGDFEINRRFASDLGSLAFVEIVVFFGVLLVGFAYLWRRGDLHWVRALDERRRAAAPAAVTTPRPAPAQPAGTAS